MPKPRKVTSSQLSEKVLSSNEPAIVLFFGEWCIDCREFKPTWESWCKGRSGPVLMIEIQRGDPEWKDWSIDEIPTVAAYSDGAEVDRAHGTITSKDLDRLWERILR